MSDRPSDQSGLTPGDPLGGAAERDRPAAAPGAPPTTGYSSPPPPGALGPSAYAAPPAPGGQLVLAGWWSRVGAQVIDGIIIAAGALLVLLVFGSVFSVGFFASDETGVAALAVGLVLGVIAFAIVALLYAPLMMARTNGRTLGRMATGIRVVRANGQPMTFGFAMLREVAVKALLVGTLSSFTGGIVYVVDVLWPLWDDENRALHDFVVDTRTVID